jgi:hypothetical protein
VSLIARTLAVFLVSWAALAQSLETIELEHRTAEEVIPILQPLLEPGGALSGTGYTLFVRASSANLAQLKSALAQIDREARQLRVFVRRGSATAQTDQTLAAGGAVHSTRTAASERTQSRSRVSVGASSSTLRIADDAVANVTVLEGSSAYIATGASVPLVTAVAHGGRRGWRALSTQYRDLADGFLVTPRVNGERVVRDVEQRAETLRDGAVHTQSLATQLTARLGEWISLGGVDTSSGATQSGVLSRRHSTASDSQHIWIKVEVE